MSKTYRLLGIIFFVIFVLIGLYQFGFFRTYSFGGFPVPYRGGEVEERIKYDCYGLRLSYLQSVSDAPTTVFCAGYLVEKKEVIVH